MSALKILFIIIFSVVLYASEKNRFTNAQQTWKDFLQAWTWTKWDKQVVFFVGNVAGSLLAYLVGFLACSTCMQIGAFAIPLLLSTPVATLLLVFKPSCEFLLWESSGVCLQNQAQLAWVIPAAVCMILAQLFSTYWLVFRSETIVLQKESQVFWLPTYNGVLLEQWLILDRRNLHTDSSHEDPRQKAKRTKVFICTTMYRENVSEMKQLLQSIYRINLAQNEGDRQFESHVFFDAGVKDTKPSEFVLQLISLVESTLGVQPRDLTKTRTPYGLSLAWYLPSPREGKRMLFRIHLKDNFKVKNKKRWSQVMYMSYVLDFLLRNTPHANDNDSFILTTDADVEFTPNSVEALLDLMIRDRNVGAVCARTHPLGNGPLVWYQVFEYAIGHWFQKVAEHCLGSVLCAPGCFSVYRCKAIREILPTYATNVEHAFDFLTKDMGEDRWFCTLMVQSGWTIQYCAASENSTHCPEEFDEFYKQRRRWIASTIANIMLLLKEWKIVLQFNHHISLLFLLYQGAILLSTLIGPSTIILVVSGGLYYAWDINPLWGVIIQFFTCIMFTAICLYCSGNFQLKIAKLLTFLYAVVMTAVTVGTAEQIVEDFSDVTSYNYTAYPSDIGSSLPISTATLYLGCLIAVFVVTAMAHPTECLCLVHGIWYLLCLPSGYLVLNIYGICNITDRSWGTREDKKEVTSVKRVPWNEAVRNFVKDICFCFDKKPKNDTESKAVQVDLTSSQGSHETLSRTQSVGRSRDRSATEQDGSEEESLTSDDEHDPYAHRDPNIPISVEEWLPSELRAKYSPRFKRNGFENTMFISGMTEKEVRDIGITSKGHLQYLMEQVKLLPDFEIDADVPEKTEDWLTKIGLSEYKDNFWRNHIRDSKDMEVLKSFSWKEIEKELGITKPGHVRRLLYAIRRLRNPTEVERLAMEMRSYVEKAKIHDLEVINYEEYRFWEKLRKSKLQPYSKAFGQEDELKSKLGELRNSWILILAVANTIWLILVTTLASKARLTLLGTNPVGLVFLIIFGIIFIIQFISMWSHRISTLAHYLARAPYKFGQAYNTNFAFSDNDINVAMTSPSTTLDQLLDSAINSAPSRRELGTIGSRRFFRSHEAERAPLLRGVVNAVPEDTIRGRTVP